MDLGLGCLGGGAMSILPSDATPEEVDAFFAALDEMEAYERRGSERDAWRERALAAEARERALEETVGELLELRDRPIANGHREGIDYCSCWDIGRSCNCYCGYEDLRAMKEEVALRWPDDSEQMQRRYDLAYWAFGTWWFD